MYSQLTDMNNLRVRLLSFQLYCIFKSLFSRFEEMNVNFIIIVNVLTPLPHTYLQLQLKSKCDYIHVPIKYTA